MQVWTPVLPWGSWQMTKATSPKNIQIMSTIDLDTLVTELTTMADVEQIMDFMVALDASVAQVDFTVELIQRLKESLEEDEPMDSTTLSDIRGRMTEVLSAIHDLENAING